MDYFRRTAGTESTSLAIAKAVIGKDGTASNVNRFLYSLKNKGQIELKKKMENHIGNLQASKETKMLQKDRRTFLKWMRNSWKKFAKLWKGRRNSETWPPP